MIQDIGPHRLYNEFHPERKPQAGDLVICVQGNKLLIGGSEGKAAFPRFEEFSEGESCRYLFSLDGENVYFAVRDDVEPFSGYSYMTLREIRNELAGPLPYMYLSYTTWHIIKWYRDNLFCGRCGHPTHHSETERALVCDHCGNVIYPRVVPAVIVGITWGDKILMTKYANRNLSYYALVAGFTEIGETLEECVAREVMEETGLKVRNIRYYKSQPWGSVQDLLMGFYCDVDGDPSIHIDRKELKEGIWVNREDIEGQADDWSLTHHMMMTFKKGEEPR